MLTAVRYAHAGSNFIWPIPFPYGQAADVRVNLVDPAGREKPLASGSDYLVRDGTVVCLVPEGHGIVIYLDAVMADALAANSARVLAAGQAASAASAALAVPVAAAPAASAAAPAGEVQAQASGLAADSGQTAGQAEGGAAGADRMSALEGKLENLFARLEDLAEARRRLARDEQVAALEETGSRQAKVLDDKTDLACETIELAAGEAEQQLKAEAVSLLLTAADIQDAAAVASETARLADAAASRANEATETTVAALNEETGKAAAAIETAAADAETRLAKAAAQGEAQIRTASESASREAAISSRLAGQAWPQQGWMAQTDDLAPGSVMALPEPLRYYPGRNSLFPILNNYVLTPGRDFEEVGTAANLSNTIRLRIATHAGDIWNFWIAPTNLAQAAGEYAEAAGQSAFNAAAAAARAETAVINVQLVADKAVTEGEARLQEIGRQGQQAVGNIADTRDNAKTEISGLANTARAESVKVWQAAEDGIRKEGESQSAAARDLWRKAEEGIAGARLDAQKQAEAASAAAGARAEHADASAAEALRLARCAWRAAMQASLNTARPGIGCVPDLAALDTMPAGVYLINPHMAAPLPFMGVWPVESVADAAFDGVFLISGKPYPDEPALPDDIPYPENPSDVPEMQPPAASGQWLPCDHTHN